MVSAQKACVFANTQKNNENKMIKQFSTIQLGNANKHLHFMK